MAQLDDPPELDPLRIVPTVFTANGDEIPSTVGQRVEDKLLLPREIGVTTVGFTGSNNATMAALCDILLAAPSDETALIQQIHITAAHAICGQVENDIAKGSVRK